MFPECMHEYRELATSHVFNNSEKTFHLADGKKSLGRQKIYQKKTHELVHENQELRARLSTQWTRWQMQHQHIALQARRRHGCNIKSFVAGACGYGAW